MYIEYVQYSTEPDLVNRLIHPDGTAEYRLVADMIKRKDGEGNDVIEGREVYFEIPPSMAQPLEEDVKASFNQWWQYGMTWPEEPSKEQSIHDLAAENKLLRAQVQSLSDREEFLEDCIAEMAVQVYGA